MARQLVTTLLLLAVTAICAANKIVPQKRVVPEQSSADLEKALDPVVKNIGEGQHQLVYTGPDGKEACLTCNPFSIGGCGCTDIVAIRCELKRLKQKMLRLKSIANPHHTQLEPLPTKSTQPKPAESAPIQPVQLVVLKPAPVPVVAETQVQEPEVQQPFIDTPGARAALDSPPTPPQ